MSRINELIGEASVIVLNQPAGLGDILFIQDIIESFLKLGCEVIHPISHNYLHSVRKHLKKSGVTHPAVGSDYPFSEHFESKQFLRQGRYLYVPLTFSYLYFPKSPVGISKYLLMDLQVQDWRPSCKILRDPIREANTTLKYKSLSPNYYFINRFFGTPPNTREAAMNVNIPTGFSEVEIKQSDFLDSQSSPFDYISLLINAIQVHTVESVFSYFIDIFRPETNSGIFLYDRHSEGELSQYHFSHSYIHRHPKWIYKF